MTRIKETTSPEQIVVKKGRKPKGGKLTLQPTDKVKKYSQITNIILHLKCNMIDLETYNNDFNKFIKNPLEYDPTVPNSIQSYSGNDVFTTYQNNNDSTEQFVFCKEVTNTDRIYSTDDEEATITDKLKKLKINLYKNNSLNKKPACFWCTYDFDNPSCYIPKYEMDETLFCYGSFCRPECAVAYLMKENIDDSTKFERYHLLNHVYGNVYDYKKNIKPAPNPHYLLEKFNGNLSIQEYRKLFKTEHFLQVVEKPMTRILPELHDDNEDNIENFYGTENTNNKNMGMYKVKRKTDKQNVPSKNLIMRENFGLA
jgi:hypothetical protein